MNIDKKNKKKNSQQIHIIKGVRSVLEALNSSQRFKRIMVLQKTKYQPDLKKILYLAQQNAVPVELYSKHDFEKQFSEENHQGVIAELCVVRNVMFKEFLEKCKDDVIVALDHLEDPYNVGAIARTCEGLGVRTIIYPKDRQVHLTAGVHKVSAGAVFHLNLVQVSNLCQSLKELQKKGYYIYGTDSNSGRSIENFEPQFPFVLVVGNEHKGVSKGIRKVLDDTCRIPMRGSIESLNVSVATGIVLFKFIRAADAELTPL